MKPWRKRILLVEDDYGTRLLLEKMLKKIDPEMQVSNASSAENAYLALNEVEWDHSPRFDLVVADINLPGSSGFLFWNIVTKRFAIDFLFISSISREAWLDQILGWAQRCGPLEALPCFLQKPLTEEKLRRSIYIPQAKKIS